MIENFPNARDEEEWSPMQQLHGQDGISRFFLQVLAEQRQNLLPPRFSHIEPGRIVFSWLSEFENWFYRRHFNSPQDREAFMEARDLPPYTRVLEGLVPSYTTEMPVEWYAFNVLGADELTDYTVRDATQQERGGHDAFVLEILRESPEELEAACTFDRSS